MYFLATLLIGATLGSAMAPAPPPREEVVRSWQPQEGDTLYVDTQENLGYLLHPDGRRFVFRVATGQKRAVRYIGLSYFAATPEGSWLVKSHHIQGDRITYGPEGHFLRMYKDADEYSHYGIHTHASADSMLREKDRYASMGCIIVSDSILDLLERTYALNGDQLPVVTASGPPEYLLAMGR
ncbi:L,D-transpeptidase [Candidatus Peregrinibacteria bacterium]|nr:L,D-transpeptidase [Candidatus Peregrinibacteria bacterium]MBI2523889.1 L,D-transpeptidase [Candidatus Peregrinibacteria bacterium]MBI4129366.1 L,D-transpeptidase [Candidatus Peregrinibacteria bacterium]